MKNISLQARPLEIYQQILEHDPETTMDDIAEVISEWGELISDRRNNLRDEYKVSNQEHDGQGKLNPKNQRV